MGTKKQTAATRNLTRATKPAKTKASARPAQQQQSAKKQVAAMAPTFKMGAAVTWSSQARGTSKTKSGKVVEIVQPGNLPRSAAKIVGHRDKKARPVKSFVVKTENNGTEEYYWPRPQHLQAAKAELAEA